MNLYKITKLSVIIIGALSVLFYIIVSSSTEQIIADQGSVSLSLFLFLSYLLMFLSVGFVLYIVLKTTFSDKEKTKQTLKYFGIIIAFIILAYVISDDTPYEKFKIGSGYSRVISTGLNLFYITAIVTLGTLVYTSVKKKNY